MHFPGCVLDCEQQDAFLPVLCFLTEDAMWPPASRLCYLAWLPNQDTLCPWTERPYKPFSLKLQWSEDFITAMGRETGMGWTDEGNGIQIQEGCSHYWVTWPLAELSRKLNVEKVFSTNRSKQKATHTKDELTYPHSGISQETKRPKWTTQFHKTTRTNRSTGVNHGLQLGNDLLTTTKGNTD